MHDDVSYLLSSVGTVGTLNIIANGHIKSLPCNYNMPFFKCLNIHPSPGLCTCFTEPTVVDGKNYWTD